MAIPAKGQSIMTRMTCEMGVLYSSLAGDPDLAELVEMFVEEMPGRVEILLHQLETSDWDGLKRSAHQLKGAAGSYGFDYISPCAAKLEGTIHQRDPEELIRQTVSELVELCNRARRGTPA